MKLMIRATVEIEAKGNKELKVFAKAIGKDVEKALAEFITKQTKEQ